MDVARLQARRSSGRPSPASSAAASAAGLDAPLVVGGDRLGRAEAEVAQGEVDGVVPLGAHQDAYAAASRRGPAAATSQPCAAQHLVARGGEAGEVGHGAAGDEADRAAGGQAEQVDQPALGEVLDRGVRRRDRPEAGVLVPRADQPVGGQRRGWVPPMTKPKNRPPGIAVSPGSQARTSSSTTSAGSRAPSWSTGSRRAATSSTPIRGGTGRRASEPSHSRACSCARSSPAVRSMSPVSAREPRRSRLAPTGLAPRLGAVKVLPAAEWRPRADAHAARVDAHVRPHLARRADAGEAPGPRLPLHLLLPAPRAAAPLAPRVRRRARGRGRARRPQGLRDRVCDGRRATRDIGRRSPQAYVASQAPLLRGLPTCCARPVAAGAAPGASGCTSGRWSTASPPTRCGTTTGRCGWAGRHRHRRGVAPGRSARTSTPSASSPRPRDRSTSLQPGRDDRAAFEQPGCLHAGMDLYKHAFRLTPMIARDLVADCFELARDIRELDMRAAPYDLADLGFEPVRDRDAGGQGGLRAGAAGLRRAGRPAAARARRGVRAAARAVEAPTAQNS